MILFSMELMSPPDRGDCVLRRSREAPLFLIGGALCPTCIPASFGEGGVNREGGDFNDWAVFGFLRIAEECFAISRGLGLDRVSFILGDARWPID